MYRTLEEEEGIVLGFCHTMGFVMFVKILLRELTNASV